MLVPVLIDQTFIALLPMVNTIIVSRLGQSSMSGVSIIDQVNQLISFVMMAIGFGGSVMVAQYTGRGDREGVERTVKQTCSISLIGAVIATGFVLMSGDWIVATALKAAEPDMIAIARVYLNITCLSYFFLGFYSNAAQLLRGIGRPRMAMIITIAVQLSTMVLSYVFIYGLRLGINGAAYANLLGRAIGYVLSSILIKRAGLVKRVLDMYTLKLHLPTQKLLIRFGLPVGIQNFFFVGARLVMNRFILLFGTDHISANVVFTQILDMQCAGSTLVSQMAPAIMGMAKGRENQDEIKSTFKILCYFAFVFGVIYAVIPALFAGQFPKIYNLSETAAPIATNMIRANVLYIVPLVWFAQAAPASFRGIGDTLVPPMITAGSLWVARVGTIAFLSIFFDIGAYASFFAVMNDYILRNILYFWRYRSGAWLRAQKGVD